MWSTSYQIVIYFVYLIDVSLMNKLQMPVKNRYKGYGTSNALLYLKIHVFTVYYKNFYT